ncbi:MAG: hypothetical protein JNK34_04040 [Tabrizicola sp.]|nr:hypothetical protein [Tabrizicola sp.]
MTPEHTLASLGLSNFISSQLDETELELPPVRIAGVHRARIDGQSINRPMTLPLSGSISAGDLALAASPRMT